MNDFMKQDIFFFVTTVAVVLLALLLAALLVYLIRIARTVDQISKKVKAETDIIVEEVGELRRSIRKEGMRIRHFTKFFSGLGKKRN
jgi:membrane protein implicated in regulation of membrane protease activity